MDTKAQVQPPAYDDAVREGPRYDDAGPSPRPVSQYPPTTHYGPGGHGPDIQYIKSVSGIAKMVQAVVCILGFIIDMTVYYPGGGFTSFSTINGFIQAVIWFILHLLHAIPQIFANYYIELIICCILDLFLFISFIISAVSGWRHPSIGAVCFFCFAAIAAYTVDCVLQFIELRRKIAETRAAQQPGGAEFN